MFRLLCRLALDGEAVETVLGDDHDHPQAILISTYDGDLAALKA